MQRVETDVVVVGGGSAGCVVAARLAERGREVVLLEAGPDYGPFGSEAWAPDLVDARQLALSHDWGYRQDRWTFERAKVIGGCSSHNGAIAAVGHAVDYDAWGLPGWAAEDVRPLFDTVVRTMRVRAYEREEATPFHARCLDAAEAMGWRIASDLCDLDANDAFGLETVNVVGTTRWNTAFGYLDPVRHLANLRIIDRAEASHLVAGTNGATVHATRPDGPVEVHASTAVICGGAYGTPALLQRSGIGDADRLRAVGVAPVHHLPGVGANLHDQPMAHADRRVPAELQRWLDEVAATGFLPEEQTLGKAISSQATDGIYDLHVFPVCASDQTSFLYGRIHVEVACMTPLSRGRVDITGPSASDPLHIDHDYLGDAEGHDIAVMRDGLKSAEELLRQAPLAEVLGERITDNSTDEAIRAMVAHYYHPVGSCRMGADDLAACDAQGRLHGMNNIFVADASLFPQTPRGNTNLPAIMAGERIATTL